MNSPSGFSRSFTSSMLLIHLPGSSPIKVSPAQTNRKPGQSFNRQRARRKSSPTTAGGFPPLKDANEVERLLLRQGVDGNSPRRSRADDRDPLDCAHDLVERRACESTQKESVSCRRKKEKKDSQQSRHAPAQRSNLLFKITPRPSRRRGGGETGIRLGDGTPVGPITPWQAAGRGTCAGIEGV